jgi:hypothetical protein
LTFRPLPQGFIKAIVGPLFKTFSKVEGVDLTECLDQLTLNSKRWKELVETEEADGKSQDSPRMGVTNHIGFVETLNPSAVPSSSPL